MRDLRVKSMLRMRTIRLALLVFGMSICSVAQTSSPSQTGTTPAPAFGQNAPVLNPEDPAGNWTGRTHARTAYGQPQLRLASFAGERIGGHERGQRGRHDRSGICHPRSRSFRPPAILAQE